MVSITDHGATVLVTRSEPGASALADALRAVGYAVRCVPVLEIRPLEASSSDVADLEGFDIAICVSGHAARLVLERFDESERRAELTWIAVGAATARVLAERGIDALRPANESSEGILALAPLNHVVGQRVLICAGRGGRPLLAEELTKRGARVSSLALYERVPVPVEKAAPQLAGGAIGTVIVSSADGARAFAPAWRASGGDPRVAVVAPSVRVAQELAGLGFRRVAVADGAAAAATIDALRKLDEESR
jgi:uroporphyrinogen-III synthase